MTGSAATQNIKWEEISSIIVRPFVPFRPIRSLAIISCSAWSWIKVNNTKECRWILMRRRIPFSSQTLSCQFGQFKMINKIPLDWTRSSSMFNVAMTEFQSNNLASAGNGPQATDQNDTFIWGKQTGEKEMGWFDKNSLTALHIIANTNKDDSMVSGNKTLRSLLETAKRLSACSLLVDWC